MFLFLSCEPVVEVLCLDVVRELVTPLLYVLRFSRRFRIVAEIWYEISSVTVPI